MTDQQRVEFINAARSYERIVAERREMAARAFKFKKEGCEEEFKAEKNAYMGSQDRVMNSAKLIAERLYGECDFIRVDNVVYMAYSDSSILRIPLDDIPDLAKQ